MRNPAPNFIAGGALVVVAVACFAFLDGPTAVFAGIAAAVGGAVLLIMGTQGGAPEPELYGDPLADPTGIGGSGQTNRLRETNTLDTAPEPDTQGLDWDAHFKREFGGDGRTGHTEDR